MSRLSSFLTIIAVLGAVWFFWPFGRESDVVNIDTKPPGTVPEWARFDENGPPETSESTKAASPRTASPNAGREGASEGAPGKTSKATAAQPVLQDKRLYRVLVRGAGSLESGGMTVVLGGIEGKSPTEKCKDTKGKDWPCGRHARTALIRLIRGRAVLCKIPVSAMPKKLTARCNVGGKDLSVWLVRHGWAEPKSPVGPKLRAALERAQKRRLGIWR